MTMADSFSPEFEKLSPRQREDMMRELLLNPPEGGAVFNGSPLIQRAPQAADPERSSGALTQVSSAPAQPAEPVADAPAAAGVFSKLGEMYSNYKVPSIDEAISKYIPQDDSSTRYLAIASALGRPTGFGTFGEKMANVADALNQQKLEQQKLRMQYLPAIMTQVAQQQQTMMNMQRTGMMLGSLGNFMQGGAQPAQQGPGVPPGRPQGAPMPAGQGNPAPQGQQAPVGAPMPQGQGAPAPQAQPQLPPQVQQAAAGVQQEWQRLGLQYPLSAGEAVAIATSPDPQKAFQELIVKHSEPTGPALLAVQAGYVPGSPEYKKYMQDAAFKGNYIAPVAARPGGYLNYADGRQEFNPHVPEGMVGYQNPQTGQMEFRQDPSLAAGAEAIARAKAMGTAGAKPSKAWDPNTKTWVYSNEALDAQRASGTVPATGPTGGNLSPELPPGFGKGMEGQHADLTTRFTNLRNDAANAQTTSAFLGEMQRLAQTAAVGRFTDKVQLMQALLAQSGISDNAQKVLTDTDLFNKYSNQIIAKQGTGALGTDAARAILQAANPNSHMTREAIDEASTVLKGANVLTQAKLRTLAPYGNNNDPVGYQKAEQTFDTLSDPVLWKDLAKYKTLQPGSAAAKSFMQDVMKRDPDFLSKMKTLHDLGAYE